ncbi:MAG: penicillin acylase family protein [Acidobacteria bacterium]|nr:penicillin acylase family protein [Acidobacteriota bacterium]
MRELVAALALVVAAVSTASAQTADVDLARWRKQADAITIYRDDWGIAHVYGRTDADAVFGVVYAQAEDDFNRVETNFINAMGRLAEAEGESEIFRDLRMKLFIDPADMQAKYASSPAWLKALMDAWADGLNYYLHTHPAVTPRVIARFEPWMALSFSEGSIGGDIERIDLAQLEAFYGREGRGQEGRERQEEPDRPANREAAVPARPVPPAYREPTGSNGIAVAPSNAANRHALLLINPHTSFFFRAEAQMVSDEGLNAYGALTWGQFFVYQGFNQRAGWMHTSSGVDNIDEYLETIAKRGDGYVYTYGSEERAVTTRTIVVPYRTASGMASRTFTVYRTHHGPIVRDAGGKWVSVSLMQDPVKALQQSYLRTKATSYQAFRDTMELHTNSSNNTIYADADGTIAYFHSNFIPRRDPAFDFAKPVDGSNPATDWRGVLSIDETPGLKNPPVGWLYNSNNWPWSAAGPDSPDRADFPAYVERGREETARGRHAIRVLQGRRDFTVDSLIAAAYDSYLPAFADLIPALLHAYDEAPASDPLKTRLADQIALLRGWDFRWAASSVPTTLAVYWGDDLYRRIGDEAAKAEMSAETFAVSRRPAAAMLESLAAASDRLAADFGRWQTPWGDVNRFQRLTGDIIQPFDDAGPSLPVPFTSSRWGSLASFGARTYPGTKKMYGTSGNSFVAVVEFGDRVRAKAVTAGGESGDPRSPHFNDQAQRYADGSLREIYYYREQLNGHLEREYHPGQ